MGVTQGEENPTLAQGAPPQAQVLHLLQKRTPAYEDCVKEFTILANRVASPPCGQNSGAMREVSARDMLRVVPQPDDRFGLIMFVAKHAQAGGAEDKVTPGPRFKPEPARRQHPQKMSARK
jgi:hypothetical protein